MTFVAVKVVIIIIIKPINWLTEIISFKKKYPKLKIELKLISLNRKIENLPSDTIYVENDSDLESGVDNLINALNG